MGGVVFDKPCVGESRERGLHDRQFANPGLIVGQLRRAHLAEARAPLALARPHLPAAAGLGKQRLAQPAREIAVERRLVSLLGGGRTPSM